MRSKHEVPRPTDVHLRVLHLRAVLRRLHFNLPELPGLPSTLLLLQTLPCNVYRGPVSLGFQSTGTTWRLKSLKW